MKYIWILILSIVFSNSAQSLNQVDSSTNKKQQVSLQKIDSTQNQDSGKTALDTNASKGNQEEQIIMVKAKKDTVIMIINKDVKEIIGMAKGGIKKSRMQGYGGAGGYTPGMSALRIKPIATMIDQEKSLAKASFPDFQNSFVPIGMSGGMGYGGVGNGIRIGGGGWGGSVKFTSSRYTGSNGVDSVAVLTVHLGYGGFMVEKAHVKENLNCVVGGILSFGGLEVKRNFYNANQPSAFSDIGFVSENEGTATANFMGLEIHGGATYTLLPWMHIGGDVNTLMTYSIDGFGGPGNSGFFGFYPGVRLRLIFGNLG